MASKARCKPSIYLKAVFLVLLCDICPVVLVVCLKKRSRRRVKRGAVKASLAVAAYINREVAQYINNKDMIVLVIRAY